MKNDIKDKKQGNQKKIVSVKNDKKNKYMILTVLSIVGLFLITVGVTYAFFNYTKSGSTTNTIKVGSITFLYTEESGKGRGITITDAVPMANDIGSTQTTNKFDFRIASDTGNTSVKYTVTARKVSSGSDLDGIIDFYLTDQSDNGDYIKNQYPTKVTGTTEYLTFADLDDYNESAIEKVLYEATITGSYNQDFRLRMWIDEEADFSQITAPVPESCSVNVTPNDGESLQDACTRVNGIYSAATISKSYPYNDKEFKIIINVYANDVVNSSYTASGVGYYNSNSTNCSSNQTVECALDELSNRLN